MFGRGRGRASAIGLAVGVLALTAPAGALGANGGVDPAGAPAAQPDSFATVDRTNDHVSAATFDTFRAQARKQGDVRVIVGLQTRFTPEGALDAAQVASQRSDIHGQTNQVVAALDGSRFGVTHRFSAVPYVALKLSSEALSKLESSGLAAGIQADELATPLLAQSTPLVEATESKAVGRDGAGRVVAILDTGVDNAHTFLQKPGGGPKVI